MARTARRAPYDEQKQCLATWSSMNDCDRNANNNEDSSKSESSKRLDLIEEEIKRLDREYQGLHSAEQTLQNLLRQLQFEEESLQLALSQASETLAEKRARQQQQRQSEAVSRLEAALGLALEDSDKEDDDSDAEGHEEKTS